MGLKDELHQWLQERRGGKNKKPAPQVIYKTRIRQSKPMAQTEQQTPVALIDRLLATMQQHLEPSPDKALTLKDLLKKEGLDSKISSASAALVHIWQTLGTDKDGAQLIARKPNKESRGYVYYMASDDFARLGIKQLRKIMRGAVPVQAPAHAQAQAEPKPPAAPPASGLVLIMPKDINVNLNFNFNFNVRLGFL